MIAEEQDALGILLKQKLDAKTLERVMVHLVPFDKMYVAGKLQLVPMIQINDTFYTGAIQLVTENRKPGFHICSISKPTPNLVINLQQEFPKILDGCLEINLEACLNEHDWVELKNRLAKRFGSRFRPRIESIITTSLFYYLGFAIAGNRDMMTRLERLVEVLPDAIPLGIGNATGISDSWIVLCA